MVATLLDIRQISVSSDQHKLQLMDSCTCKKKSR